MQTLQFGILEKQPGEWVQVINTSLPIPDDIVHDENNTIVQSPYYRVAVRSVVVLVRPD